ncbi:MAG: hypothetical protein KAR07_10425 [Spirochaetes bacterium]|nr:hypothetical protein [Spirochaetota bacterium]
MKPLKYLLILISILLLTGCQNPESAIKKTLKDFGVLLDKYIAHKNKPDKKELQNKLGSYISKNKNEVADLLETVYKFRFKDPLKFNSLYKKHKNRIINVLRKMERLDKNDKIIFRYFSFVFSPEKIKMDMDTLLLKKRLFIKYCDLLEALAKN